MRSWKQVVGASLLLSASPVLADMGRNPVGSSGTTVSVDGGYLLQDGGSVTGHGIATPAGNVQDVELTPRDGYFIGGMLGFADRNALISGTVFNRIEVYGLYGSTEESVSHASPPLAGISLKNVDGTVLVDGGAFGASTVERTTVEGGLRFEGDDIVNATTSMTWVVSPFIRWSGEKAETVVTQCCDLLRSGNVDTVMYGLMVAAEPEFQLTNSVALVARLGAGLYGYSADGEYRSSDNRNGFFAAQVSDSSGGVGFRGVLGAALKFKLTETTNLETFAEADYFSDVGTAGMPNNQPTDTISAQTLTTDLWELRTGARVTIGFSGTN
ncbi:MAG: hypothetical protein ABL907_16165 [Hyphomicrobium sp.]